MHNPKIHSYCGKEEIEIFLDSKHAFCVFFWKKCSDNPQDKRNHKGKIKYNFHKTEVRKY